MRRLLAVLFGGALVIGLAACGGDDDTAAPTVEDTTTDDGSGETDDGSGESTDDATTDEGDTEETTTTEGPETTEASDDGGETPSTDDVCALISAEDVAAAVPEAGALEQESLVGTCSYTSIDPFTVVTVTLQPGTLAASDFDAAIEAAAGFMEGEFESVEGIGDAAAQIGGSIPILFVANGDDLLSVSVLSDGENEAAQQELAQVALDNM